MAWLYQSSRVSGISRCCARQGLTLDLREPGLVQGGDQKVVNFEQILLANERMLNPTEAPAQRARAFSLTF
jgi:hypothetical protein